MKYQIDIRDYNFKGERVCGELETTEELTRQELIDGIQEFAIENKICPSYALEHCFVNDPVNNGINKK